MKTQRRRHDTIGFHDERWHTVSMLSEKIKQINSCMTLWFQSSKYLLTWITSQLPISSSLLMCYLESPSPLNDLIWSPQCGPDNMQLIEIVTANPPGCITSCSGQTHEILDRRPNPKRLRTRTTRNPSPGILFPLRDLFLRHTENNPLCNLCLRSLFSFFSFFLKKTFS